MTIPLLTLVLVVLPKLSIAYRGWIRLIVSFQPLMVISPTASWILWCMQVYACELMWTCLVWAGRSMPDSFWVPSHRFNFDTDEQKWITQTIYTDSEPPSRLPNLLMPSAKLRSANLPVLRLWCDAVGDRTPASHTLSGHSNHRATHGRYIYSLSGKVRKANNGLKLNVCVNFMLFNTPDTKNNIFACIFWQLGSFATCCSVECII